MWKKVIAAAIIGIASFAVLAAIQPAEFSVDREISIAARPSVIFPLVNDFHQSITWSPWVDLDPGMTNSFEGASAGVGSIYTWDGNDTVGAGRMTMTESVVDERVRMRLENYRPFESTSTVDIVLTPLEDATIVRWSLSGRFNFFEKAFSLFVSMDDMIGPDFEKGLKKLKALAESTTI